MFIFIYVYIWDIKLKDQDTYKTEGQRYLCIKIFRDVVGKDVRTNDRWTVKTDELSISTNAKARPILMAKFNFALQHRKVRIT